MGQRLDLHEILCNILGSRNVYFQPPTGFKMTYDCIVYKRDKIDSRFAGNRPYTHSNRYSVTVISRDPESPVPSKLVELPMCVHDRYFTSDNLHHNVFTLYY